MKRHGKWLALLLALCVLIGSTAVFAESTEPALEEPTLVEESDGEELPPPQPVRKLDFQA